MSALLSVKNVSVTLGTRRVLENVSFEISAGEFIGLIGPNGAGKSTLLKTAAGLIRPDNGACASDGKAVADITALERARRFSYLPQARPVFWSVAARDIVALGRFAYGAPLSEDARDEEAIIRALADTGAAHLADRSAAELSGGELARVHLARALAGETPLLLADEPIAALDPAHQLGVMQLLKSKTDEGRAVIAALHDLALAARYCTRLIVLKDGGLLADGAPKEVLSPELLENAFDVRASIGWNDKGASLQLEPLT